MSDPHLPGLGRAKLSQSFGRGALAVGLSVVLSGTLGALATACLGDRTPYSGVLAVACCATVAILGRPRARATSLPLLGWVPYIFGAAAYELANPIVQSHWRCGNGDIGLILVVIVSLPIVFTTTITAAAVLHRHRLRLATFVTAVGVAAACVAALVASVRRLHHPDADGYLAGLPAVATMAGNDTGFDGPGFSVERRAYPQGGDGVHQSGCMVTVTPERGNMSDSDGQLLAPECSGVRVLRDEAHGYWIVLAPSGSRYALKPLGHLPSVGLSPGLGPTDIMPREVASSLRPPTAWMLLNGAGCLVVLVALALALRERRRPERWRNARPGVHRGGWVTFADGAPPVHIADAGRWPAGDVLVLEAPRIAPHYREHGRMADGARVAPGTLSAMADAADARATGLCSFAILVGLLTLAPMAACYLVGLLG